MARNCALKISEILEAKPDRAPAEKRIQLVRPIRVLSDEFVAPEVEGANDERRGAPALGHGPIGLDTALPRPAASPG